MQQLLPVHRFARDPAAYCIKTCAWFSSTVPLQLTVNVRYNSTFHPPHCKLHHSHCTLQTSPLFTFLTFPLNIHTSRCQRHTTYGTLHTSHCTLHTATQHSATHHTTRITLHTSHFTLHTSQFTPYPPRGHALRTLPPRLVVHFCRTMTPPATYSTYMCVRVPLLSRDVCRVQCDTHASGAQVYCNKIRKYS
jgi:hypothetical protein